MLAPYGEEGSGGKGIQRGGEAQGARLKVQQLMRTNSSALSNSGDVYWRGEMVEEADRTGKGKAAPAVGGGVPPRSDLVQEL